jgi:hypothetical protein
MKAKIRKGLLIVATPLLNPPQESKSGKTILVANSRGPRRTGLRVDGKPVVINLIAYVRPDGYVRKAETRRRETVRTVRRMRRSKPKAHASLVPRHKG